MSLPYSFALALAAGLLDVTLGYPEPLARRIGTPASWLQAWLGVARAVGWGGGATLALYLAPIAAGAAAVAFALPDGPLGFAATALLASAFCGRQTLDKRASEVARTWETQGSGEALAAAEALGPEEQELRLARATAAAVAARFADEVAAPTIFILLGGLTGAVLCRALGVVGRDCRERRDNSAFARSVATLESFTLRPAAFVAALWLSLAAGSGAAFAAALARPHAPAEAVMLAALGDPQRDDPAHLRRALALFRRAAATELMALAAFAIFAAFAM